MLKLHHGQVFGGRSDDVHRLFGRLLRERAGGQRMLSLRRRSLCTQRGERGVYGLPDGLLRLEHRLVKLRGVRQWILLGSRRSFVYQVQ